MCHQQNTMALLLSYDTSGYMYYIESHSKQHRLQSEFFGIRSLFEKLMSLFSKAMVCTSLTLRD
jgi:hypothetical protein